MAKSDPPPTLKFEREAWKAGAFWVAGVDEAGAGPLPYTLIRALGPRYRDELEAEVESAMDSLGDPDDAFRYHHSYLIAVARKR